MMDEWCVEETVTWDELGSYILAELETFKAEELVDMKAADEIVRIIIRRWPCDGI